MNNAHVLPRILFKQAYSNSCGINTYFFKWCAIFSPQKESIVVQEKEQDDADKAANPKKKRRVSVCSDPCWREEEITCLKLVLMASVWATSMTTCVLCRKRRPSQTFWRCLSLKQAAQRTCRRPSSITSQTSAPLSRWRSWSWRVSGERGGFPVRRNKLVDNKSWPVHSSSCSLSIHRLQFPDMQRLDPQLVLLSERRWVALHV